MFLCFPSLQQRVRLNITSLASGKVCEGAGSRSCLKPVFLLSFVKLMERIGLLVLGREERASEDTERERRFLSERDGLGSLQISSGIGT